MDASKIIIGTVGGGRYTVTAPIVKEDYGLYLKIEGIELPATYQVDFSNSEHNGTSVTMIGNSDGVLIPHQFIDSGKDVFAFLYHVGVDFGRTVYKFRIPNKVRPDRTDEQPEPEEQSVIDQAISALNSAVAQTAQDKADADVSAQNASADAERAGKARTDAQNYATQAERARDDAQTYANNASASATASATSASQTEQIKSDVEDMVDDAQASASASAQSASASANSASQASGYAQSASQSASSAQGYASQAQTSAQTASTKASEASTSASTASAKATESAQSASQAQGYANTAEQAKTSAQTAQGLAESARDLAQGYAEDAQGYAEDAQASAEGISASASQIAQNTANILKAFPTDTASGAIASFSDGADGLPLKSLIVNIDPVQDLHGYDSPWVAGGGKNLFDQENVTVTGSGVVVLAKAIPAGTYTISALVTSTDTDVTYNRINLWDENNAQLAAVSLTRDTRASASFTIASACAKVVFYAASTAANSSGDTATFTKVQIESGNTATDWTPYENICPISGWTEVQTNQSGVNVWDEEWEVGGIGSSTGNNEIANDRIRTIGYIEIKPSAEYYCSIPSGAVFAFFYDANKTFISPRIGASNRTFTTPSNARYMRFHTYTYGNTYNHDISINYPSTDHDYHPYTGRSITIDLGQTVYGGKLDVLSGVLTIEKHYGDLSGASIHDQNDEYKLVKKVGFPYANSISGGAAISDVTNKFGNIPSSSYNSTKIQFPTTGTRRIFASMPIDFDVSTVTFCYDLAEPIEIQLDAHTINSLFGQNNIFADTGDTSTEYRADTRLYIEKLTKPEEDDMIANSAITSGQFFMIGNSLYKALTAIASGATITVGTNAQRVSLSDALNLINA